MNPDYRTPLDSNWAISYGHNHQAYRDRLAFAKAIGFEWVEQMKKYILISLGWDPDGDGTITSCKITFKGSDEYGFDNITPELLSDFGDYVTGFEFINCGARRIPENLFDKFPDMSIISFRSTPLEELPENLLVNLPKIAGMEFSGTRLRSIPDSFFAGKEDQIWGMSLQDNDFEEVPPILLKLPRLGRLSISNNPQLQGVTPQFLQSFPELKKLDLSNIGLQELPVDLFAYNPKIYDLNLSHNPITELPETVFAKNHRLSSIKLIGTQITDLPKDVFRHTTLERLILDDSSLERLPPDLNLPESSSRIRISLQNTPLEGFPFSIHTRYGKYITIDIKGTPEHVCKDLFDRIEAMVRMDRDFLKHGRAGMGIYHNDLRTNRPKFLSLETLVTFARRKYKLE